MYVKIEIEVIDNIILEVLYNWIFFIDDYV